MQPKLLPLSLREGNLTADGGFTVLSCLGSAVTARRDRCMESALVLGISAHGPAASRLDTVLGNLMCNRCAGIGVFNKAITERSTFKNNHVTSGGKQCSGCRCLDPLSGRLRLACKSRSI